MVNSDVLLIIRQEHLKQLFHCYLSISPLFKRKDTNVVQVFKYAPLVNPCVTETFPSYYLNIWPKFYSPKCENLSSGLLYKGYIVLMVGSVFHAQ